MTDRLPPHSAEAEAAALGCILLSPAECLSECGERGVGPDWFYVLDHQNIFRGIQGVSEAGATVDLVTLYQWLKDTGTLPGEGIGYLSALQDKTPSAVMLGRYLEILADKRTMRRIVKLGAEMMASCYDESEDKTDPLDVSMLVDKIGRDALALSENTAAAAEIHVKPLILENLERLEEYHRGSAQITGLTTGMDYVDKITGGLGGENGNFIVIAARPGMGKTSIGVDFLVHVALDAVWFSKLTLEEAERRGIDGQAIRLSKDGKVAFEIHFGLPAAFFTLEMSPARLVRRMMFQRSGADIQRFRTGYAIKTDFDKLHKGAAQLSRGNIWIDGTKRLTIDLLKSRCRRLVRQRGIKMFVLDYLQLMKSDRRRYRNPDRVAEMEEISSEIAALGCELDVPFFVLAQLNRDLEKAERKRSPQLSDIKNCGAIEQDADVVMMLWEPRLTEEKEEMWAHARKQVAGDDWSQELRRINLLVEKNRDGATGDCELVFHKKSTHFEDYDVFLKRHDIKEPAAGERKMPTNEEML